MITKVYDKIKLYIKQNFKFLLILIIFLIAFTIELPFYIDAPGGLLDVSDRVEIKTDNKMKGSFNLAYVSEFKATIPTIIYAFFDKDWDILPKEEVVLNETVEQIDYRNHLMLDEANQNAIIVGFNKAGEYYQVTNRKVNVVYVYEEANTDLQVGDQILKVNNKPINSKQELFDIIQKNNDKLEIEVINNGIIYTRYAYKTNIEGEDLIGIVLVETKELDTNIEVNFKFKKTESGPSGGFMMALSIYNYLIEEDITKGLKIVGTGTIDEEGNVGSIGGVNYKIKAAVKENADIFFVPVDNYEEALKTKEEFNLDIDLIQVDHIDDAINYLNEI